MAAKNKVTNPSPEGSLLGTTFGRALLGLLPGAGPWIGLRGDSKEKRKIGDLDGGGIYVGKSAAGGRDLHAALADEAEYLNHSGAFDAAARMSKQPGRENAHVPTPEELTINLYENKNTGALKGTFNTNSLEEGSIYRAAGVNHWPAWFKFFDDGYQGCDHDLTRRTSVRLVW